MPPEGALERELSYEDSVWLFSNACGKSFLENNDNFQILLLTKYMYLPLVPMQWPGTQGAGF